MVPFSFSNQFFQPPENLNIICVVHLNLSGIFLIIVMIVLFLIIDIIELSLCGSSQALMSQGEQAILCKSLVLFIVISVKKIFASFLIFKRPPLNHSFHPTVGHTAF